AKVHDIDLGIAILRQHECEPIAIRRERRGAIETLEVGDLLAPPGIDVLHEDARSLLLERNIGDTATIGRIARRQDRLARLQQGHGAGAVVVGALQRITGVVRTHALGGHVEQACGERALDPGEFFERLVGNVVGHVTQLFRGAADAAGHHLLLRGHVEHRVLHLQPATGRLDVADQQVLGTQGLPVTENDLAGPCRHADHVLLGNGLEYAGVAHVVADDLGHVFRQHVAALPTERYDGDRNRTIATAGDDDVFLLRDGTSQHQRQENDKTSEVVDHNARSSGVNVIVNERYGWNSWAESPCISVSRPIFFTAATAELSNGASPLDRETLTEVIVPSGSMFTRSVTDMLLRADGGRVQPCAARIRMRSSKSPATWSPWVSAMACWRWVSSASNSASACAFLSSAALRAASAAAFFLASSAAFFFAASAAAFFFASSAAFFLASSAAFFFAASSAAFFFAASSAAFFLAISACFFCSATFCTSSAFFVSAAFFAAATFAASAFRASSAFFCSAAAAACFCCSILRCSSCSASYCLAAVFCASPASFWLVWVVAWLCDFNWYSVAWTIGLDGGRSGVMAKLTKSIPKMMTCSPTARTVGQK